MMKNHDAGNGVSGKDDLRGLTPPVAFTVREFCRVFGVGKTYAHKLISQGTIKKKYAGKRLLITGESAAAWFDNLPDQAPRNRPPPRTKLRIAQQ